MSDTTDTSNSSVIFVAEQKTIHVEVHPTPQTHQNSSETNTNQSFVPETQPTNRPNSTPNSSSSEVFVVPETGKYKLTLLKLYPKTFKTMYILSKNTNRTSA